MHIYNNYNAADKYISLLWNINYDFNSWWWGEDWDFWTLNRSCNKEKIAKYLTKFLDWSMSWFVVYIYIDIYANGWL